jgi:hypothetical protein
MQQRAIGGQVHFEPFLVANVQQLVDLRMEQRFAFHMKINMFSVPLYLIKRIRKGIDFNKIRLTLRRRTEAAGKVAYARYLDVKLLEFLQFRVLQSVKRIE